MTDSFPVVGWGKLCTDPLSPEAPPLPPLQAVLLELPAGAAPTPLSADQETCLRQALAAVLPGGLIMISGAPAVLSLWGEYLLVALGVMEQVVFKYWIAIDQPMVTKDALLPARHFGVLLFQKRDPARKTPPPFVLHTGAVRIAHRYCKACQQNVKDWGGKKHLMNPLGAAPSDVWRDFPPQTTTSDGLTPAAFHRLALLAGATPENSRRVLMPAAAKVKAALLPTPVAGTGRVGAGADFQALKQVELDHVYAGDAVAFLHRVEVLHPYGLFDLAFADPPYNLEKSYGQWDDALAEQHYVQWCNAWLAGMAATLKPGGSLMVLNLPKWALHHAAFLQQRLDFRHWIVWDALSDPRGKLMPAHYALLWYTKPGGKPGCNYSPLGSKPKPGFVTPPDAPDYCLRAKCLRLRKARGDDAKTELSDIWWDIHRIKHKRDRDAHPCQLPEKLMERIIKLASRPGDVVFDPFCGAGTTAIAAMKLGRKFVVTDLDKNYVRITNEKLAAMREHQDMYGEFLVPRQSTKRERGDITKREIESYLQELAHTLGRVPTEADLLEHRPGLLPEIDRIYPNRGAAFKRAKIGL